MRVVRFYARASYALYLSILSDISNLSIYLSTLNPTKKTKKKPATTGSTALVELGSSYLRSGADVFVKKLKNFLNKFLNNFINKFHKIIDENIFMEKYLKKILLLLL